MQGWRFLIIAIFFFLTSCGGNTYESASGQNTAEALYEDALKLTDSGSYDAAFDKLTELENKYPDFASSDDYKKLKAGTQAGQCGLNFINFVEGLSSATGSSPFLLLMQAFKGISVNPQKCIDAVDTMNSLSHLDDDQLLFMAILGMSKVGVFMRDRADRDGTDSLGDGSADATFDACDSTAASNRLTDDDMKQVITGLGMILQNFALIGGTFSGSSADSSLQALQSFCDDPLGDGTGPGNDSDKINCDITDPNSASLDATTLRTFRRVLESSDYGVGTCNASQINPMAGDFCCPSLAYP